MNIIKLHLLLGLILAISVNACSHSKKKVVKEFYMNKNLHQEYEINDDSVNDGYYKSYYSSGRLANDLNYKLGELDGKQISYDKNGKIGEITYYTKGVLDSGKYFDSLGNFERNVIETVFKSTSDTIKVGVPYLLNISLNPQPKRISEGKINIFINESKIYNSRNVYIGNPIVIDSFYGIYNFKKIFSKPGNYIIECEIYFIEDAKYKNSSGEMHKVTVLPQ